MAKAVSKKRKTKERVIPNTQSAPPRRRILPPEIIHIILELFKHDKTTLRACSLAAREFSRPALSYIGQHITVNYVPRIKKCVQSLTSHSAFQHVRSLDLGVTSKSSNPEDYLEEQLTILEIFAQRQTLTCLWLSNLPFPSIESCRREKIRDVVAALSSTVNNLGLYGCRFPSYTDMISFVRAFPHCDSLYIRDCVTSGEKSAGVMFSGLPKHKLSLDTLELTSLDTPELTSRSSKGLIIDVSSFIKDAALGVSQLSALICGVGSAEQARCVAIATSASPIRYFQLTCIEPGGFQAFLNPMAEKWSLESLTIGPLSHKMDYAFLHNAFHNFPNVPHLREFTIIYHYPNTRTFDIRCWDYFRTLISRADIFPNFMKVDIRPAIRSLSSGQEQERALKETFFSLRLCQYVTLWGERFRW